MENGKTIKNSGNFLAQEFNFSLCLFKEKKEISKYEKWSRLEITFYKASTGILKSKALAAHQTLNLKVGSDFF